MGGYWRRLCESAVWTPVGIDIDVATAQCSGGCL